MDLIERYVKAVSRRLPEKRRADVEAELRSAIMDVADGRGATTEDEVAAVLREFGDPATVAAGYDPSGQYLIGPELYPSYLRILGQGVAIAVAIAGMWLAVRLAIGASGPMEVGHELWNAVEIAFRATIGTLIGITATFVVFQRIGVTKTLTRREWDPRDLPAQLDADRVSRLESGFSLVVLAIAMAIIGAIGREAQTGIGDAPAILRPLMRGALLTGIPWLIASMLVEAIMHAGLIVEGRRRLWTRGLHVASDVLAVVAFGIAAVAVVGERDVLRSVGMPDPAITVLYMTLLLIALGIGVGAVTREHRITRRRAEERAGTGRPAVPPLPV